MHRKYLTQVKSITLHQSFTKTKVAALYEIEMKKAF
jgi:hypothetical protein